VVSRAGADAALARVGGWSVGPAAVVVELRLFAQGASLMKSHRIVALSVAVLALALVAGTAVAEKAASVKSGPQVGEELAGPFHPLNVNGKKAGKKHCLYCENGNAPVAMIFAREPSPSLTKLIKKLDAACVKNKSSKMASFVVFCNDDAGLEAKLKALSTSADLKKVVLSIDNPAGPKGYNVAKDADITVVLYTDRTVKANCSFAKDGLTEDKINTIISELPKILPKE
jgi:hypothetical protein